MEALKKLHFLITKWLKITQKNRLKKQQRKRINKHKKSKHRYNLSQAHYTIAKYKNALNKW